MELQAVSNKADDPEKTKIIDSMFVLAEPLPILYLFANYGYRYGLLLCWLKEEHFIHKEDYA